MRERFRAGRLDAITERMDGFLARMAAVPESERRVFDSPKFAGAIAETVVGRRENDGSQADDDDGSISASR